METISTESPRPAASGFGFVRTSIEITLARPEKVLHAFAPLMRQPRTPSTSVGGRTHLEVGVVRADVRLRHADRDQHLAGGELRQPVLPLRLGPSRLERVGEDLGPRVQRSGRAERGGRQLLGHHHHRQVAHAGAAVLLRDRGAEEAEGGEALDQAVGDEQILAVDVLGDRGDLVAREVARGLAREHRRVVAQIEVVDAQRGDRAPPQLAHARLVEARAHRRAQLGGVESVRRRVDAEVVA